MAAHQAPPSLGFSRQEHWSGLPFPSPVHESEKWKWSCSVVSRSHLSNFAFISFALGDWSVSHVRLFLHRVWCSAQHRVSSVGGLDWMTCFPYLLYYPCSCRRIPSKVFLFRCWISYSAHCWLVCALAIVEQIFRELPSPSGRSRLVLPKKRRASEPWCLYVLPGHRWPLEPFSEVCKLFGIMCS